MNGRIAWKKAAARNLWWWSTRRELKRERANLRRMNRKTRGVVLGTIPQVEEAWGDL